MTVTKSEETNYKQTSAILIGVQRLSLTEEEGNISLDTAKIRSAESNTSKPSVNVPRFYHKVQPKMEEFEMREIPEEDVPNTEEIKDRSGQKKKKVQPILLNQYNVVYSAVFEYFDRIFVRDRNGDTDGLVEIERGQSRWRCCCKDKKPGQGQEKKKICGKTNDELIDVFLWMMVAILLLILTGCLGYLGITLSSSHTCDKN